MKYQNASLVLPHDLLEQIKEYIQGEYLYIPADETSHKKWGESSGTREKLKDRNEIIYNKYLEGYNMDELSQQFFLSIHSIKKIIYGQK